MKKFIRRGVALLLVVVALLLLQNIVPAFSAEIIDDPVDIVDVDVDVDVDMLDDDDADMLDVVDDIIVDEEFPEQDEIIDKQDYMPPVLFSSGGNVRLKESNEYFDTLSEAIAAANGSGMNIFTLEVVNDVSETSSPVIGANMNFTIVGAEGEHTVSLQGGAILVQGGGSLTLGDGTNENLLTINAPLTAVQITNGEAHIRDGVRIVGNHTNGGTVLFDGTNASGTISGGIIEGNRAALRVYGGSRITEISGGELIGRYIAIEMDSNRSAISRIDRISDGRFTQWEDVGDFGLALYVQNDSWVGEITGGYFEATLYVAVLVVRGGWIETISGGEFVMTRALNSTTNDGRTGALFVNDFAAGFLLGYSSPTGVGTISGGHFHGGHWGVCSISRGSQIRSITGGIFEGVVALQNDRDSIITEISGGKFTGGRGLVNIGIIEKIGGSVEFRATRFHGFLNYLNGVIKEISGGTIISDDSHGISNTDSARIDLISDVTIIGKQSAIHVSGGRLGAITSGIFWGKNDVAIHLTTQSPLMLLEPGLTETIGLGRFWGIDEQIFNDDALVTFPLRPDDSGEHYHISTNTMPAGGFKEVEFKFLRTPGSETDNPDPNPEPDVQPEPVPPPPPPQPKPQPQPESEPENKLPERQAYLIGSPNGLIRPDGNITRAEVATIFFRLITDEAREQYWMQTNPFPDVMLHNWFNNAVSTMANAGVFIGRPDGTFAPDATITRAEMAAAIVRFMDVAGVNGTKIAFSDIAGHWAADYINAAAENGWIFGYPDGTFRPDQPIARAEVAAMVNRIFGRLPEIEADLLADMIIWPDNANTDRWYYLYIQSASNSYAYKTKTDGIHERWLTLIPTRDWVALERPDSVPEDILR